MATVTIKLTPNGETFKVPLDGNDTIQQFKISASVATNIPAEEQRLVYKGHLLKDDRTLDSYGSFPVLLLCLSLNS